jgi:hypothetical protein
VTLGETPALHEERPTMGQALTAAVSFQRIGKCRQLLVAK